MRILIVEDDAALASFIRKGLEAEHHAVDVAIASHVLETAGAPLVFGGGDVDPTGFVLRIPRRFDAPPRSLQPEMSTSRLPRKFSRWR